MAAPLPAAGAGGDSVGTRTAAVGPHHRRRSGPATSCCCCCCCCSSGSNRRRWRALGVHPQLQHPLVALSHRAAAVPHAVVACPAAVQVFPQHCVPCCGLHEQTATPPLLASTLERDDRAVLLRASCRAIAAAHVWEHGLAARRHVVQINQQRSAAVDINAVVVQAVALSHTVACHTRGGEVRYWDAGARACTRDDGAEQWGHGVRGALQIDGARAERRGLEHALAESRAHGRALWSREKRRQARNIRWRLAHDAQAGQGKHAVVDPSQLAEFGTRTANKSHHN